MGVLRATEITRYSKFSKVTRHGVFAEVLVRLMMVSNDLTLAEDSMVLWQHESNGKRLYRQRGARMYFIRVQMSHIRCTYGGGRLPSAVRIIQVAASASHASTIFTSRRTR